MTQISNDWKKRDIHAKYKFMGYVACYLNKRCCEPIQLNNLLTFHKISNISIRIGSSSPQSSAFQNMQVNNYVINFLLNC